MATHWGCYPLPQPDILAAALTQLGTIYYLPAKEGSCKNQEKGKVTVKTRKRAGVTASCYNYYCTELALYSSMK